MPLLQVQLDVLRCQASIIHALVYQLVFGERRIVGYLYRVGDRVMISAISALPSLETTTWDGTKVSLHRDERLDLRCRLSTLVSS